jgi:hypothetical protein
MTAMTQRTPERATARPGGRPVVTRSDDTAVRPGFAQQVKERVAAATTSEVRTRNGTTPGHPPATRPTVRRARLKLTRIDPWSVMKTAFLLSIAVGVVMVVSVFIVWSVLGAAGVWESINKSVQDIIGTDTATDFDITEVLGTSRVMGFTTVLAVIDVVLLTAVATLGAFLYNTAASLLGGIDVTLTEER